MSRCIPPPGQDDDNSYHEVWWNSIAGGVEDNGRKEFQLHAIWQWMGDAAKLAWLRPGDEKWYSAEEAYAEGWRYVRPIKMMDEIPRFADEPPSNTT